MIISKKLRIEIKLASDREYRIAQKAGLHPSTLSKLLNGIAEVKPDDPRVIAIGKVLGLQAAECFESASV